MPSPEIEKLKAGDFNAMNQEWQLDGSVLITLSKRGEGKTHRLHIKKLYQPDEEILSEDEEIPI